MRVCGSGFEAHCRLHRDDDRETRWRRPLAKNSGVGSMACPKLITERAQEGRRRQRLRVQSLHPSSVTLLPRRAGRSEPSPAMQRAARHSAMILPGSLAHRSTRGSELLESNVRIARARSPAAPHGPASRPADGHGPSGSSRKIPGWCFDVEGDKAPHRNRDHVARRFLDTD